MSPPSKLFLDKNHIDGRWKCLDKDNFPFGDGETIDDAVASARILTDAPIYTDDTFTVIYDKVDSSDFMKARFNEIVPVKKLDDCDIIQVEKDTRTAFEIIGFKPVNFQEAFQKAWESSDALSLSDFIYDVWRHSDGS